jgi:Outer membrane protein beta-barrel domain
MAGMARNNLAMALLVALPAAPCARAQDTSPTKPENSITIYGGERFGGSLTDSTGNSTVDLENGSSFAAAVDIGLDHGTQLEFFYSRQNTAVASSAFSPQSNHVGLELNNYHLGGTAFIEGVGRGLYVMGGLGATTAKSNASGRDSQTFLSGNIGVGWMVPLGRHVGLRFEARGYGILLSNNTSVFCGDTAGCTAAIKGNAIFEGEVLAGISARF